jgi:hypothetical protein
VAYFVDSAVGIINEGDTMTFNVSTTAVPDGTVLYWKVENETTTDARFAAVSGSVTVSAGAGSFGITPLADLQTEGTTIFHVTLRTGSVAGTVVWTTGSKAIGDTSLTPPVPGAGRFVEASSQSLQVAQPSYTAGGAGYGAWAGLVGDAPIFKGDYPQPQVGWTAIGHAGDGPYVVTLTNVVDGGATWILYWTARTTNNLYKYQGWDLYDPALAPFVLGTTWTIEFWLKANNTSLVAGGGIWGLLNQVGWSTTNAIVVALSDAKLVFLSRAGTANDDVRYTEPPPGIWTHVAIVNNAGTQKVFYNGIEQTKVSGTFGTASYTNPWAPLYIGRLGPQNGGTLDGKITNVRITDRAQYAGTFTPALVPVSIPGHTRFLWTPTDQAYFTDTGDSALTIANSNGVTFDTDYPSLTTTPLSLVINGDNPTKRYFSVAPGNHFNLSTTWTIEYWSKARTSSGAAPITVMGQQYDGGSNFDIFYYNGRLCVKNGTGGLCPEPTPGIWRHVAIVSDAGYLTVYYDGRAVYSGQQNYSLSDTTTPLYIGRRGTGDFQYFDGKITNIRISNTAQYSTDFTPDVQPANITGTKFLLNPTSKQVRDQSDNSLAVVGYQVSYSTEYPQSVTGIVHPYSGGTLGTTFCLLGNPKFAAFQSIPVGARITSNIAGFGVRTVGITQADLGIGWTVIYDPTGLTGVTSDTDTFNFYW